MNDDLSYTKRFNQARIQSRDIAELLGICKGVLADGILAIEECYFIVEWLAYHPECLDVWPANVLSESLNNALEDGKLSSEEESELLEILCGMTGMMITTNYLDQKIQANSSTMLPTTTLDQALSHKGSNFVVTGKFNYGNRKHCESAIVERGGRTQKSPTKDTHVLIIGDIGNDQWAQSSFGRKIEKAMAMNQSGQDIKIISESEWVKYL
ncbi:DNA ligase [BD1-7 clade bacterium]|uniref:DNA ligase n=1 Tax=BD1-7 clade bacterium TaxID=2029982 RepID=A0A5S9NWV7_9GAMM|nr:DNA ligase [BD1-7 clade bacterium]CAA0095849.1 DNA ligase [BD1-7 clade bacterium]